MGQEIESTAFKPEDFLEFSRRVAAETDSLAGWIAGDVLDAGPPTLGVELEVCLLDGNYRPAPVNAALLARLADCPVPGRVDSELAAFNIELNSAPLDLGAGSFLALDEQLTALWNPCVSEGAALGVQPVCVGILPTLEPGHLSMEFISESNRYLALNDQIMRMRQGQPFQIDIDGRDRYRAMHNDIMMEAATTGLQLHLKVPPQLAARYYNAAQIASAPLLALGANSPLLFGRQLWAETRIPVFKQSVDVGHLGGRPLHYVSFGKDWLKSSLLELFEQNRRDYPSLLPELDDGPENRLAHLALHNGTIWRWNRPVIETACAVPHLRIENRVLPGGPTQIDMLANAALFYGLVEGLVAQPQAAHWRLEFATARDNFYLAARHGLNARLAWGEQGPGPLAELFAAHVRPLAAEGLARLGVAEGQIVRLLNVLQLRVDRQQNGASWQCAWMDRHGPDMAALTAAYAERQRNNAPVGEWNLGA